METGLTYTLQRVHWQFFGTLTFKSVRVPERVRRAMFICLMKSCGRYWETKFQSLVWAVRQEPGEITNRLHFHFLLAGLPPEAVQKDTCLKIMGVWERIGGGMARVREFDSRRVGVDYLLKCLETTSPGANSYEVGKFSHCPDGVMLSDSIWRPQNLARISG